VRSPVRTPIGVGVWVFLLLAASWVMAATVRKPVAGDCAGPRIQWTAKAPDIPPGTQPSTQPSASKARVEMEGLARQGAAKVSALIHQEVSADLTTVAKQRVAEDLKLAVQNAVNDMASRPVTASFTVTNVVENDAGLLVSGRLAGALPNAPPILRHIVMITTNRAVVEQWKKGETHSLPVTIRSVEVLAVRQREEKYLYLVQFVFHVSAE
jgi:hypothetical protein